MLLCLVLVSCKEKISTDQNDYIVTMDASVSKSTATIKGRVFSSVDLTSVSESGFLISEKAGFKTGNAKTIAAAIEGEDRELAKTLTLEEMGGRRGVPFYYRAYLVAGGKQQLGAEKSFMFDKIQVTGLTLDKTSAGVIRGETVQLTATVTPSDATDKEVAWSSSDDKVATVSQTGLVTAVGRGSAVITASAGGLQATCPVTVRGTKPAGAVDLGLSVYWAETPILKSESPLEYRYFCWGETAEKEQYAWGYYKYYGPKGVTKYNPQLDNLTTLLPEDDAATQILGKAWRTPTKAEWEELLFGAGGNVYNSYTLRIVRNGQSIKNIAWGGYMVNSRVLNGQGTVGYFMTADLYRTNWEYAYVVQNKFDSGTIRVVDMNVAPGVDRSVGVALLAVSDGE